MAASACPVTAGDRTLKVRRMAKSMLVHVGEYFKHLLPTIFLFFYLFIGAAVIEAIEGAAEQQTRKEQRFILNLTGNACYSNDDVLAVVRAVLDASKSGIVEVPGRETAVQFNYWGSFYFVFTAVTTIGYGNVAPSTRGGKAFCVVFALFGIPLCLICLARIGASMNEFYQRHIVKRLDANSSKRRRCLRYLMDAGLILGFYIVFFLIPAAIFTYTEKWHFSDGLYYSFVTLSTIGFGDYVAGNSASQRIGEKLALIAWIYTGLAVIAMFFSQMQELLQSLLARIQTMPPPQAASNEKMPDHEVVSL